VPEAWKWEDLILCPRVLDDGPKAKEKMIGIVIALFTALGWAVNSVIVKYISGKMDSFSINILQLWSGSIILVAIVFLSGRGNDYIHTPVQSLIFLAIAGILGMAVGNTVYVKSLSFIDVSRAFAIAMCAFPMLTIVVAILLLAEPFTWVNVVGAILVVVALYLIVVLGRRRTAAAVAGSNSLKGVALAFLAAVLWMMGTIALRLGATEIDAFIAAAIRVPIAAMALTGLRFSQKRREALQFKKYGLRNVGLVVAAGVLQYGVAAVGYVVAIQMLGAGRAVLITAVAPIFVLPFSIFLLKEKPTIWAIGGVVLSVLGVILVSAD
jgi:drug/metabolite transporter (DMT)-like permease